MLAHQILITFDAAPDFAGQRDLASQAPEPKLTWHLQKVPGGWLLLSEHFGFIEHITQPKVTASMVEEFIC